MSDKQSGSSTKEALNHNWFGDQIKFAVWQNLLEEIVSNAPSEVLKDFSRASSLRDKVEICYNNSYFYESLKKWLSGCVSRPAGLKNTNLSISYRESGNTYCRKKKNLEALKFYNKALLYALKNSDEQKSAYGNRSHVLLQLSRFEESLKDIERALDEDKISARNVNLLLRKSQVWIALGQISEARNTINGLLEIIGTLPDNLQQKITQTSEEINNLEKSKQKSVYKRNTDKSNIDFPNIDFTENPDFRYASKSLRLKKNESKGRFVVANDEIRIGDVLFAERPFSFVILPNMIDKYCSFCCKRIFAPVPCDFCALAYFCNETCRDSAFREFHSMECGGLEICYSVGIVHLSLRVALQGLLEENSEKYIEVKNLVSHLNDLQLPDLLSYTVTATLLTMYLEEYTDMFKQEHNKKKLFEFGGTILLHIGQLVCNGHAITDVETSESDSEQSLLIEEQVRVATAIYPSASMMNHSCKPNIINSFFNTLLIVRATENLKSGNEVFNCYGPMAYNTEFSKRQEILLSQYFFVCGCDACQKREGPISDKFLCKKCSAQLSLEKNSCDNCSYSINTEKLIRDLDESDQALKEGIDKSESRQLEKSIELLSKALRLRETHCHADHRKLLECRDNLAKSYALLGQEEKAFVYLKQNIQAIENIYGKISIELGQEIMKLLSVATNLRDRSYQLSPNQRNIIQKSLEYGEKGLLIFKLSYGDWHPRFQEMERLLNYLQTFGNEVVGEHMF